MTRLALWLLRPLVGWYNQRARLNRVETEAAAANVLIEEVAALRLAISTARQQIRQGHGTDWAVDTLRDALNRPADLR